MDSYKEGEQLHHRPREVIRILKNLELQQSELDRLILTTGTGVPRVCLTQANIFLLSAINSLKDTV